MDTTNQRRRRRCRLTQQSADSCYLLEQGAKNAGINLSRDMANRLSTGMRSVMEDENWHLVYQTAFDDELAKLEGTL